MSAYVFEVESGGETGPDVVTLVGEVDLTNARELAELLQSVDAFRPLVVDLRGVTFLDSAALHVLFTLVRSRSGTQTGFVVEPGSGIARTLAIVKLDDVARVAATREELGLPST